MAISQGPATHNEKEIKTRFPVVTGTTAATTKQVGSKFLHAGEERLVPSRELKGVY